MHWTNNRVLIAGLVVIATITAPVRADDKPTAEGVEFFETRVRPLLVKHCYECHGPDAKKVRGELRLDTRAAVDGNDFAPGPTVSTSDEEPHVIGFRLAHGQTDVVTRCRGDANGRVHVDVPVLLTHPEEGGRPWFAQGRRPHRQVPAVAARRGEFRGRPA